MHTETKSGLASKSGSAGSFKLIHPANPEVSNWLLAPGTCYAGREPDCDIVIDDCTVSRRHACLHVARGKPVRVVDLGSRNGIRINSRRVEREGILNPGDRVSFGAVTLMVQMAEDTNTATASDATMTTGSHTTQRVVVESLPVHEALSTLGTADVKVAGAFKALSDMAGMLATHQSLEVMFQHALKRLSRIIEGQRFAVFRSREEPDTVDLITSHLVDPFASPAFSNSRAILREVMTEKRAVHYHDLAEDLRLTERNSVVLQRIRSAMAVPLIDQGRVLGVLYTDTMESKHRYNEEALKLMATCGHLLAAKITQHQLLMEQKAKRSFETDLKLASRMQQEFMPLDLPDVEGYTFHAYQAQCKHVGGDLYDIGRLPDGRVMFLIADVSGKSMGAALLASSILSAFRILRGQPQFDLADAVRRVSMELINSSRMADFATLFIGILDPREHSIEYVNAGHEPPLLVCANGARRHLESGNMAIGVLDDVTWTKHDLALQAGDRLILSTDGLQEATDDFGNMYSRTRMESFALEHRHETAAVFARALVKDVYVFRDGKPPCDDMTMILVDRNC